MAQTAAEMVADAKSKVPDITPEEVSQMTDTLVVDVRDAPEIAASGKVPGAVHVSRGMLEFRADPASPHHDKSFDPSKPVVVYCETGGRSALAGVALQQLGYTDVRNMGGFKDWLEKGLPIEK